MYPYIANQYHLCMCIHVLCCPEACDYQYSRHLCSASTRDMVYMWYGACRLLMYTWCCWLLHETTTFNWNDDITDSRQNSEQLCGLRYIYFKWQEVVCIKMVTHSLYMYTVTSSLDYRMNYCRAIPNPSLVLIGQNMCTNSL